MAAGIMEIFADRCINQHEGFSGVADNNTDFLGSYFTCGVVRHEICCDAVVMRWRCGGDGGSEDSLIDDTWKWREQHGGI